jgi:iron uptake system component EfeO
VKRVVVMIAGLALAGGVLAACGGNGDDGSGVRTLNCDEASASGSGAEVTSGSGSGAEVTSGSGSSSASSATSCPSGSGSGSGLSQEDLGGEAQTEALKAAVTEYRTYVDTQVAATIAATTTFTDAVRAGDVAAAKAAYGPSRVGWESIEPIAALVEKIDGKVDARVDDFESETDPTWTGWHRLEYLVFEKGATDGAAKFADQLDADLATLQAQLPDVRITPLAMARGASELIEEVSQGKITGEEDRYSHTDLIDIQANVDGAKEIIRLLGPSIEAADPELLTDIDAAFAEVQSNLDLYRDAQGGFVAYEAETMATPKFKAALASLSESLALVPGALDLK